MEEPFIKIDSNYSEAIEEAHNQKARIKKNYANIMEKARLLGRGPPGGVQQVALNVGKSVSDRNVVVSTPDLDEEVNKIERSGKDERSDSVSEYYETEHRFVIKQSA